MTTLGVFRAVYVQSTCLVSHAVPALCVGTEYKANTEGGVDETKRHIIFASSRPTGDWDIAMGVGVVESAVHWCFTAAMADIPVVTWDGARAFQMFAQYPISAEARHELRMVTERMIDLSVLAATASPASVPVSPASPFPLLDWISGNRAQQMTCLSWSINYLDSVIGTHSRVLSMNTPEARACLSPVAELLDASRLAETLSPDVARATSEEVAERVAWTDRSVFS